MNSVATQVLATVNAPYGADLSTYQLATMIADPKSAIDCVAPVFAFFSEVSPDMQKQFITAMKVDASKVANVARAFSELSGYTLPLAA